MSNRAVPPHGAVQDDRAPPGRDGDASAGEALVRQHGVLCFGGEDWWYHNRGHADMQYMRQLAALGRVLYINSIVMRKPNVREGRMFWRRVARKARSMTRGLVPVAERMWVYSPVSAPVHHLAWARPLNEHLLRAQVRIAAARVGLRRPIIWVNCPAAAHAAVALPHGRLVYQRTDCYEGFPGVDRDQIARYDRTLKAAADLTFFSNRGLYEAERHDCRRAAYVDHGVDYERFAAAGDARREPADVARLPRPRVGFIGGIDRHTFNVPLFLDVARRVPEATFVLVGGCSLPGGWCDLPNVQHLGQRPYEQVADYMAACDVLIMPWNQNEWIRACNPIKLKEYLAVGRPVVSTPFEELAPYATHVAVAADGPAFAAAVRAAGGAALDVSARRAVVRRHGWDAKAHTLITSLVRS